MHVCNDVVMLVYVKVSVLVHDGAQTPADICSGIAAASQAVQIQYLTLAQLLLLGHDLHAHCWN